MKGNSELIVANTQNTQPTVKDGAQEKFYKKFQEINKRIEQRIQKEQKEKFRSVRVKKLCKYFDAARALAERLFGWGYDDFESVKREHGELALLDKLLLRKVTKKLLTVGFCAFVPITAICIANVASVNALFSMGAKVNPPNDFGLAVFCAVSWVALAVVDVASVYKSAKYFNRSLRPYFTFLYNRKQALLLHQELENEAEADGT